MFRFLGLYSAYPFMFYVGEFFYYSINLSAIILGWYWVGKKLAEMGYARQKMFLYVLTCMLLSFPVGFASSRAVGMFYYPSDQWSLSFFLENLINGKTHTFHGSIILPILTYLVYGLIFRFRVSHLLDTVFLYIPLGHVIGRVSCLIVGCCWGHHVTINFFGLNIAFQNPTPLWEIGYNFGIFYFLKQLHAHIYLKQETHHRNLSGAVMASYLCLYGVCRLFMEIFRSEKIVFQGLTQAQITMLIFISIGLSIFGYIKYIKKEAPSFAGVGPAETKPDSGNQIGTLLSGFVLVNVFLFALYYLYQAYALLLMLIHQQPKIAFQNMAPLEIGVLVCLSAGLAILFYTKHLQKIGSAASDAAAAVLPKERDASSLNLKEIRPLVLMVSYMAVTLFLLSLFYYLVMKLRVLPFPFQRVYDLGTAYKLILTYLPFLVLPIISIVWLKKAQLPIWEKFKIQGDPKTIIIFTTIGLAASVFYSLDLLVLSGPRLRGAAFWPPVLILSVINAFTEEIAYRLTAYRLVLNAAFSRITAILLQAVLYSAVHFFFNPTLGAFSLVYGIIMGVLMDRTQSVTLCIICHFIIDLGAIGKPILAY